MTVSPLTYEITHRFPIAVLQLRGQLTPADTHLARGALLEALAQEPTSLVADLSGISDADEHALRVLTDVAQAAQRWPGAALLLCAATPGVAGALRRAEVCPALIEYASCADALTAAAADPVPPRIYRRLEPTTEAPRTGRALAGYACWQWGLPEQTTSAQILASELIANAVRHARTPVGFALTLRDGRLRLSVLDGVARPARMRTPTELDEQGRGLLIVDAVADGWGSMPLGTGKVVWAEVPTRSRATA